jgi:hypothetical protein
MMQAAQLGFDVHPEGNADSMPGVLQDACHRSDRRETAFTLPGREVHVASARANRTPCVMAKHKAWKLDKPVQVY